jgi:hypothetical protein
VTGPRDWDKELAEIDKLMGASKGLPPAQDPRPVTRDASPPAVSSGREVVAPATGHGSRVTRPLTVWLITLLGPIGAAGLAVWPYSKACGMSLAVYLVGVLAVWGASIWAMRTAWAARRGVAMLLGILTLLMSLALAAMEVLPRVGYARTSLTWTCST